MKPGIRLTMLALCAWAATADAARAQNRHPSPETLEIVAERQNLMARMLETVNRVAPRLGSESAAVNPAHWPLIRESLGAVEGLLRESRAMWPARSNLGWGTRSRATPGLWSLPDAFARHYDAAESAFPALYDSIAREDAAGSRDGFCRLVAACGSCHGAFRKIDQASLYREGPQWLGRYPACDSAE